MRHIQKVGERVEWDVVEGVISAFTGADLSRRVETYEDHMLDPGGLKVAASTPLTPKEVQIAK